MQTINRTTLAIAAAALVFSFGAMPASGAPPHNVTWQCSFDPFWCCIVNEQTDECLWPR